MTLFVWDEYSGELVEHTAVGSLDWKPLGAPIRGVQKWTNVDGRNGLSLTVDAPDRQAAWSLIAGHPDYLKWEGPDHDT